MNKAVFRIVVFLVFLGVSAVLSLDVHAEERSKIGTWTQVLDNGYIGALETTPFGLLAGENDTRLWLTPRPFNGIYVSQDMGDSWLPLGLDGVAVTDIDWYNGKLYATHFLVKSETNNGLYVSENKGLTWIDIGPNFGTTCIEATDSTLYLGSKRGLWVSHDHGDTWNPAQLDHEIGTVFDIESSGNVVIATSTNYVYKSLDNGYTWEEIFELRYKSFEEIAVNGDTIVLSPRENELYISKDNGETWEKSRWRPDQNGPINYFNGLFFVFSRPQTYFSSDVFYSRDQGQTWNPTGFDDVLIYPVHITYITGIYSDEVMLFMSILQEGVYSYKLSQAWKTDPILSIPFDSETPNDLVTKISAYFDHQYPLLGYDYYSEPEETSYSLVNFKGIEGLPPKYQYSSHDGYDYALSYGTPVLAAKEGWVEYFYCDSCGNSLKIRHLGGYETIYMHLQENALVTTEGPPIWVDKGQQIGLVGMTGNSTGAHLHFAVKDGATVPDSKTDPYGWQSNEPDPWENFSWEDSLGTHQGSKSVYLWEDLPENLVTQLNPLSINEIRLKNLAFTFPEGVVDETQTVEITRFSFLNSWLNNYLLTSPEAGFMLQVFDFFGNRTDRLSSPMRIEMDLDQFLSKNVKIGTLNFLWWDGIDKLWKHLPTTVNQIAGTIVAETDMVTAFTVVGEKIDPNPPETLLQKEGTQVAGYYTQYPTITLSTNDIDTKTIFYSVEGENWKEYETPITIDKEGVTNLRYRSIDENENLEETQSVVIKVDTEGVAKSKVRIENAVFGIATQQ